MVDAAARAVDTRSLILDAARSRLLADGYAGLSTRKVAAEAGVPLSQLHYHFGSKGGLILALFEEENRELLGGWFALLAEVANEAEHRHGPLGPFTAEEAATLVGTCFVGAEALLLLGFDREVLPIRSALRRVGVMIRQLEEDRTRPGRTDDAGMPAGS